MGMVLSLLRFRTYGLNSSNVSVKTTGSPVESRSFSYMRKTSEDSDPVTNVRSIESETEEEERASESNYLIPIRKTRDIESGQEEREGSVVESSSLIYIRKTCDNSDLDRNVRDIESSQAEEEVPVPSLQDDQLRWVTVGICLHNIISPALRTIVIPTLRALYADLKKKNIHTQTYPAFLDMYKLTTLNYEAINNNSAIPKCRGKNDTPKYDYKVKDEVDLSKLFLQTHMAQYTSIDDTCDSSALLNIIINVDKFPPVLRSAAKKIKNDIRNPWAHCGFSHWNSTKFQDSFTCMKNIITHLNLPQDEEKMAIDQLSKWESNASNLLDGSHGIVDALKTVKTETSVLAKYCRTISSASDENFTLIAEILEKATNGDLEKRVTRLEERAETKAGEIKTKQLQDQSSALFCSPPRTKNFFGRENDLKELQANFDKNREHVYTQAICGLGGIGKSTLANEYSHRYRKKYPGGIFWILSEDKASVEECFLQLALKRGYADGSQVVSSTLNWLSSLRLKWLLVLDNLDGEKIDIATRHILTGDWKHGAFGDILITTRREGLSATEVLSVDSYITPKELSVSQSALFMKRRSGFSSGENDYIINSLVKELHGLPLALEQAAAHINILNCSFQKYLDGFKKQRLNLLKSIDKGSRYQQNDERLSVLTTWKMNIECIERMSVEQGLGTCAIEVMEIFALLPHTMIFPGALNRVMQNMIGEVHNSLKMSQVIEILSRYSIVNREERDVLIMHRLVKDVIEEYMSEQSKMELLKRLNDAVMSVDKRPFSCAEHVIEERTEKNVLLDIEKKKLAIAYNRLIQQYEMANKYQKLMMNNE